jgi:tryptophan synthase alpha chain
VSRIASAFARLKAERRAALITFITAGDPSIEQTVPLMRTLVEAGADILELGVPFSDPQADGPVIQRASERALARKVTLRKVLDMVTDFRKTDATTPVVLMGYANPIEAMGWQNFAALAQRAGVDGVLVVDIPPEESEDWVRTARANDLDPIFLLAPTSTEARVGQVSRLASGFVYYVSLKGVTGAAHLDHSEVAERLPKLQAIIPLPVGVGFGIRDADSASAVAAVADAVVVGSRIIQEIETSTIDDLHPRVSALTAELRDAIDAARRV